MKNQLIVRLYQVFCLTIIVSFFGPLPGAMATETPPLEVGFSIPEDADLATLQAENCDFIGPAANGNEVVFKCPLQRVYQLSYKNADKDGIVVFGNISLRSDLKFSSPASGPLHVVSVYEKSQDAATENFAKLNEVMVPLITAKLKPLKAAEPAKENADVSEEKPAKPEVKVAVKEDADTKKDPVKEPEAKKVVATPEITETIKPAVPADDKVVIGDPDAGIEVVWSSSYGTLEANEVPLTVEQIMPNGMMSANIKWREGWGDAVTFKSSRNPRCKVTVSKADFAKDSNVKLPCSERILMLPVVLPMSVPFCNNINPSQLTCLISADQEGFELDLPGWQNVYVKTPESATTISVNASDLRPEFSTGKALQNLADLGKDACEYTGYEMRVSNLCATGDCVTVAANVGKISEGGFLPSLEALKWTGQKLPTGAEIALVGTGDGSEKVLAKQDIKLGSVSAKAMEEFVNQTIQSNEYTLKLDIEGKIYKYGRKLQVFSDKECKTEIAGKSLDLSNPGNKRPKVPQCGFYRLFDKDKPRSECLELAFDSQKKTVTARAEVAACAAKRLVIAVVENDRLNGVMSEAVVNGLRDVAKSMRGKDECMAVDFVHTVDEKREVLLSAEDIFLSENDSTVSDVFQLNFVNPGSEVLRDFDWIDRTWGDNLAGVIVILDGSQTKPDNMTESPAAMAWTINQRFRRVIDVSESGNCESFTDTLRFEGCVHSSSEAFKVNLQGLLDEGLTKTAGGQ